MHGAHPPARLLSPRPSGCGAAEETDGGLWRGALIDAPDHLGWTPLHDAAMECRLGIRCSRWRSRCDVGVRTLDSQTAEGSGEDQRRRRRNRRRTSGGISGGGISSKSSGKTSSSSGGSSAAAARGAAARSTAARSGGGGGGYARWRRRRRAPGCASVGLTVKQAARQGRMLRHAADRVGARMRTASRAETCCSSPPRCDSSSNSSSDEPREHAPTALSGPPWVIARAPEAR